MSITEPEKEVHSPGVLLRGLAVIEMYPTRRIRVTKNIKLPKKPSAMIRMALEDLKAVEKMKDYKVNMNNYHQPAEYTDSGKCEVCFAGAIIARQVNDPTQNLEPAFFPPGTMKKLYALDKFRRGEIYEGLNEMGLDLPQFLTEEAGVTPYEQDKKQFKAEMKKMADVLEIFGL
jgi:hypothetical protein